MSQYKDGWEWGVRMADAGEKLPWRTRNKTSAYQMGCWDGFASRQDFYTAAAMRETYRRLKFALAEQRGILAHHGRRSWMGREARKLIAAIKQEMLRRGRPAPPGPEPDEKLSELLKTLSEKI